MILPIYWVGAQAIVSTLKENTKQWKAKYFQKPIYLIPGSCRQKYIAKQK